METSPITIQKFYAHQYINCYILAL